MQVVVVGAGIVGLACAHALSHRGHRVSLLAADAPLATTSAVAGASFKPRAVGGGRLTERLLADSRAVLVGWDQSGFSQALGIVRHRHTLATDADAIDLPYARHVDDVARRSRDDGDDIPGGYRSAVSFTTWFFDVGRVLVALVDHLAADHGVAATTARLSSLEQATTQGQVVVNATALGARWLVGDDHLEPIRGQGVVVPFANPPDWSISADGAYAYPREDGLFLGGTAEVGSWSLEPDPATTARILVDNARTFAALGELAPGAVHPVVGLRPYRHGGPRVELDRDVASVPVLHAYGHGGAGWTLATGTAERVSDLADRVARHG